MNPRQNLARFAYYLRHAGHLLTPPPLARQPLHRILAAPPDPESAARLAYYLRLPRTFPPGPDATPFSLNLLRGRSTYQLDLWEHLRRFPPHLHIHTVFGDNTREPDTPAFVKSRPVSTGHTNAILFRLNHIRHFHFVPDPLPFHAKLDRLVWRGNACQPHRRTFLQHYFNHPLCNVGHYHRRPAENIPWTRGPLSIRQQLRHKFILAIEGNDVATNLKWVLASNSLCFMTRPRYETWFMEGALQPGIHYVQLNDDYSDLDEKLRHYTHHPDDALPILRAANAWARRFQNPRREAFLALTLLHDYFHRTGQLP